MVAGEDDHLAAGPERLPHGAQQRDGVGGGGAHGHLAQLEAVAEHHEALDPVAQRLEERLAEGRPAEQVDLGGGTEVQVGDDERGHRGPQ